MKIGVLVPLTEDMGREFEKVVSLGLSSCQVCGWGEALMTREAAEALVQAQRRTGISISTFWCGWSGPAVWNFIEGPTTLGVVPPATREMRVRQLKTGSDFARAIGVTQMATHAGFIPEVPSDPLYPGLIEALRDVATRCRDNGQQFLFETGQETPTTLVRAIEDIGTGNLGVNLDPANLLLYGKANPVDALSLLGPFVRDVHAKDGEYPTGGRELGVEKALGEGRVNFPALVAGLKRCGYDGALTIEREISGDQQIADIQKAKALLEALIA